MSDQLSTAQPPQSQPGLSRPGSLARNVLSNWFVLASNITYALFITPIVVRALDKEMYGVWSFLNGLLVYSELLYLGLGAALIRYVAQFRVHDDQVGINRLVSVVIAIYGLIGLACLVTLIGVSPAVPRAFAEPLSPEAARAASYTCWLLGVQLLFIFIGSAISGLISGHDRYDLVNAVYVCGVAIRFVATPVLIRSENNPLVMLALITSAVAVLQALALARIAFWHIRGLSIRPTLPKRAELRMLYEFGLPSFFILFAVRLISYTDTTVIGIMLGAASVALYSLPLQLVEYARAGVSGFTGVLLPRLTTLTTQQDLTSVREAYLSSARVGLFLTGWLVGTLICLGPAFLNVWIGPEFGTPVQWVLVCLAVATFGQVLSTHVPFAFYQALHLVSFPSAVLVAEALSNLILSIWLAPRLGITGVALATAIPALLVSVVLLPPYLCRRLGVPLRTFVVKSVLPGLLLLVATVLTEWISGLMIRTASYPAIIARAMLTLPVVILLFSATFPSDQQHALWRLMRLRPAERGQ